MKLLFEHLQKGSEFKGFFDGNTVLLFHGKAKHSIVRRHEYYRNYFKFIARMDLVNEVKATSIW